MCVGCEGYPAYPRHPLRGPPHHDPGHPLRLQLRVQAAWDGEGNKQDQGGNEQKQNAGSSGKDCDLTAID